MTFTIDWNLFGRIIILMALSLGIRALAFKRFDSIAIDLSFSSFAYNAGNIFFPVSDNVSRFENLFFLGGLFSLLALLWVHRRYLDGLHDQIIERIKTKKQKIVDAQCKDLRMRVVDVSGPLLRRAILLTFTSYGSFAWLRPGKLDARNEAAAFYLETMGIELKPDDFAMKKGNQIICMVIFFMLGLLSVACAVVRVNVGS